MSKKGLLRKAQLLEGLQEVLAEHGFSDTTFQRLADHAGVSQSLVVKNFKTRERMILGAFEALLADARELTESHVSKAKTATEALHEYASVSVKIFFLKPSTPRLYALLYYLASFRSDYREFNNGIRLVALSRIKTLIELGIQENVFFENRHVDQIADALHSSLTGILMNASTSSWDSKLQSKSQILEAKKSATERLCFETVEAFCERLRSPGDEVS